MKSSKEVKLIIKKTNENVGKKLHRLRALLMYSKSKIGKYAGIDGQTIGGFESGDTGGFTDKLSALILFFGYSHKEFYDFEKPLPSERQLKNKMKRFHEKIGSDAYKIIYDRPELIDLIEFRLLDSDFFDDWKDADELIEYCKKKYDYEYLISSVPNTLNNAVQKGWLIRDDESRPKRYKKKSSV